LKEGGKYKGKDGAMANNIIPRDRPLRRRLHPVVYDIAIGLIILFTVSAWLVFDRKADTELPLSMITMFFVIAIGIPAIIARVWRRKADLSAADRRIVTFREWMSGEFPVWGSHIRTSEAMVDMLLPLAAVSFGMVAIGIVFIIVR
jgi:hypothetical protein